MLWVDHGTYEFKMGDGIINTEIDLNHCDEVSKQEEGFETNHNEDVVEILNSSDTTNIDTQELDMTTAAVQMRHQARQDSTAKRPLKITVVNELNLTPKEFQVLQEM